MSIKEIIVNCTGFDWDEGNIDKNWKKHKVAPSECEQIFFNSPLLLFDDERHSGSEIRLYALGRTDEGRKLFIAMTVRKNLIRIISARDMNKKERRAYEKENPPL